MGKGQASLHMGNADTPRANVDSTTNIKVKIKLEVKMGERGDGGQTLRCNLPPLSKRAYDPA